MSLTPMDIHQKEFKSARLGGYNEEDVDAFLDLIADELEKLLVENESFKTEIDTIRKRLSEFEEMQSSLQSALITATKSAEDVKTQSTREAEDILFKAKKEAESIVRYAQDESGRIIGEAKSEEQRIDKKIDKVRQVKREYLESIKQIAEMQIKQAEELGEKDGKEELSVENKPPEKAEEVINSVMVGMQQSVSEDKSPENPPPAVEEKAEAESKPVEMVVTGSQTGDSTDVSSGISEPEKNMAGESSAASTEHADNINHGIEINGNPHVGQLTEEKTQTRKQDLVQEVLGMEFGDDIYSGLEDMEEEKRGSGKRMFGRKDRKDRNQFWE